MFLCLPLRTNGGRKVSWPDPAANFRYNAQAQEIKDTHSADSDLVQELHQLIITDRLQSLGLISHGTLKTADEDEGFFEDGEVIASDTVLYQSNSDGD